MCRVPIFIYSSCEDARRREEVKKCRRVPCREARLPARPRRTSSEAKGPQCDRTVRCGTDWPSRTDADASRGTDTTQWNGRSVYPDPVDARGACASRVAARGRGRCRGQTTLSAANDQNSPGR
eukprot:scaffold1744_cov129-Isochrysis_galbana.AAC.8